MTTIRRFAIASLLPMAIALLPDTAAASVRMPTASARAAQDTTFKPEGTYTVDVAVGGQSVTMSFVVAKKADGSLGGVFKHAEIGEFATTDFKVEGRKMWMGIVTPGGPATITMNVAKDNVVEGEWSMAGDGSKISGKKSS